MFLEAPPHFLHAALANLDPKSRDVGIALIEESHVRRLDQPLDGGDLLVGNGEVENLGVENLFPAGLVEGPPRGLAVTSDEARGPELRAAEIPDDRDARFVEARRPDRREDRFPRRSRGLAGVRGAAPVSDRPGEADVRGVVEPLLERGDPFPRLGLGTAPAGEPEESRGLFAQLALARAGGDETGIAG